MKKNRGVSLWQDGLSAAQIAGHARLQGERKTEVAIVGGGLTGVLCAHFLREAGVETAIVEAGEIGQGITAKTTAKITAQHGLFYHQLMEKQGRTRAGLYLRAAQDAVDRYQQMITAQRIDCDFVPCEHVVYALKDGARDTAVTKIEQEVDTVRSLGFPAVYTTETELPLPVEAAVAFPGQGHFHPLKFLMALTTGQRIYTHSPVLRIGDRLVETPQGKLKADCVILACHFPFFKIKGLFPLRLHQARAFVIAGRGPAPLQRMYLDASGNGLSFRSYGEKTIVGGPSARPGQVKIGWADLAQECRQLYPQWETVYCWANQDCMALDHMPYIGRVGSTAWLLSATGYNKWGMSGAMMAATLLTDLVLERENPVAQLFSPKRHILHPALAGNIIEAVKGLCKPTMPRCSHLGCALDWNGVEQSWDCSCHGSRFGEEGTCLNGPAKKSAKIL